MKARVKVGFRLHKLDNTFTDVEPGEIVEVNDIASPLEREERLAAGHLVIEAAPKKAPEGTVGEAPASKAAAPKGKK